MSLKSNTNLLEDLLAEAKAMPTADTVYNSGYGVGLKEGYDKGVAETEAKTFWTKYMGNCSTLFKGAVFPPDTELVFELPPIHNSFLEMFQDTKNVVSVKLIGTSSRATCNAQAMFRYNSHIKKVDLSECYFPFSDWYMAFSNCYALEEIIGELKDIGTYANNFTSTFGSCSKLKEVRFAKDAIFNSVSFANCSKLSDASIQSIIDGLKDLTGASAKTIIFHADVGGKLTDEQKTAISAKNWTLAY